jgi:hypothetical protein
LTCITVSFGRVYLVKPVADASKGNGTQALVMPLNAASHAEDLAVKAGKPAMMVGRNGKRRRGWKGFYGSVHDIVRLQTLNLAGDDG